MYDEIKVRNAELSNENTISFFLENASALNEKNSNPIAMPIVEEETSNELSPTEVLNSEATLGSKG